jgi:hypothetical protein
VVNRSLGNLSMSRTICKSSFEVVYDRNPASPIDHMSFFTNQSYSVNVDERAKTIKEMLDQVRK